MSVRLNIGMNAGTLLLLVITIVVGSYIVTQVWDAVNRIEERQNKFITNWENRVKFSNQYNNATLNLTVEQERQLLNITKVLLNVTKDQQAIFDLQLNNEKNIIGNLTDHRHVANYTRDQVLNVLNKTNQLINHTQGLTSAQYDKQAENKVNSIIGNMTEKFDILFRGLNISTTDTNTESYDGIKVLKKQLDELEQRANESQRSQTK
jgi:hypothetical protein